MQKTLNLGGLYVYLHPQPIAALALFLARPNRPRLNFMYRYSQINGREEGTYDAQEQINRCIVLKCIPCLVPELKFSYLLVILLTFYGLKVTKVSHPNPKRPLS